MRRLFLGFAIAACGTLPAFGQEPAELFDKLDANKDGVITSDEVPDDKQATFERLVRSIRSRVCQCTLWIASCPCYSTD